MRVRELWVQGSGIPEEEEGRLIFFPIMQDVPEVEAGPGVRRLQLDGLLEARSRVVETPLAMVQVPQVDDGGNVGRIQLERALIRPLRLDRGGGILIQLTATVASPGASSTRPQCPRHLLVVDYSDPFGGPPG